MPYRRNSNSPLSVKSKGTVSINSIHPDEVSSQTVAKSICSEKLFSAGVLTTKKSVFINVTSERTIHVQHYAQKPEHLLHENNVKSSDVSNVVLFLIHGVGGSSDIWNAQINYFLNKGYDIISLDLLGHGKSSKPRNHSAYLFNELASDVLYIFDTFCQQTNVVIGHSYGSCFCTMLSKERGASISKMVLISGGGPTTLMPDRCSAFCLPMPMFYILTPALIKMFRRMAFHVDTDKKIRKKITAFGISSHVLKATMQGQHWSEADEQYHADLVVPVLLIYGKGDQLVSVEDEIWMNETIYGSELEIIENAGHMVMVEAPTLVNNAIHKFLNRDPSTRLGQVHAIDTDERAPQSDFRETVSHSNDEYQHTERDTNGSIQVAGPAYTIDVGMSRSTPYMKESLSSPTDLRAASRSTPHMRESLSTSTDHRAASRLSQVSTRSSRNRKKTKF